MPRPRSGSTALAEADGGALRREFEIEYRRIMDEQGVATDAEELAVCIALRERAEMGEYPREGRLHIVSTRDDSDYGSDEVILALKAAKPAGNQVFIGMALLGALLVLTWFLFFKGSSSESAIVSGPAATQTAFARGLTTGTPGTDVEQHAIGTQTALALTTREWGGPSISVGADANDYLDPVWPQTLELDGMAFRVYPSDMEGGRWEYEDLDGAASWVARSVINWSFGIPDTEAGIALFERLADAEAGEKVAILRLSSGVAKRFKLQKPRQIGQQEIEVFAPYSPGLTVALLGSRQGSLRWTVYGQEDYADDGYDSNGEGP